MKKTSLLITLQATVLALAGCNPVDEFADIQDSRKPEVNITGGIHTRATAEGFVGGDAVGIYVVNYDGEVPGILLDEGNQADHVRYTFNETDNRWIPEGKVYYKDDKTHVDIYGYYPYERPEDVSAYGFEVRQDQSLLSENGGMGAYEASDFLWGMAADIAPTNNAVRIGFSHIMSCALVTLEEGTGFASGEFDALEASVLHTGTTRKAVIDISTGSVTPSGDAETTGTVMNATAEGFRAIVVPQTVAASVPLFSITIDGVVYRFRKDEAFTFPSGKMSRFTIKINKKEITGTYELDLEDISIVPWIEDTDSYAGEARQYYTVHVEEPGTLGATLKGLNKDGTKIKNLKVTGNIDKRDFSYMNGTMTILQAINLKEVKITEWEGYPANEIPNAAFFGKRLLYFFIFPEGITKIGDRAFEQTSLSGTLIIPDGIIEIGNSSYRNCNNITGISFPPSLRTIRDRAFYECRNIKSSLSLPQGLEYIGNETFYQCDQINGTLTLPESLTYIGSSAFYNCDGFTGSLKIPENITKLYSSTFFGCNGLRGQLILHDYLDINDASGCFSSCKFTGELVLPKNLIKIPSYCFSNNLFSSIAGFPESLVEIGNGAFQGCLRLSGILEIPKELVSIKMGSFDGCRTLEGIVLPEKLAIIESNAFADCVYINSIVSKSLVPPVVFSGAFDGVPKDNFTVEVPELSVNTYQQADGWRLFKRISAYRDFSINRRFTHWLSAGGTNTLYLKALYGAAWSVESKPDWVSVSPENGTGKCEVEVTTAPLTKGSGNRTGEIVFRLEGTDYTQKTTVEQYDYTYGDGDVVTLKTATKGKGIDIVMLGDCYDAKDIASGAYLENMKTGSAHLFTVEPYKTYADYFNVYAVFGLSEDSGIGTINLEKNARFGSQYLMEHGIEPDIATCFEYACKAPIDDNVKDALVILIPNTTTYGGITYMWGDGSSVAVCPMSEDAYPYDFRGIIQHEAGGHAFGKLGDEYIYTNYWVDKNCDCKHLHDKELRLGKNKGWYRNLSLTSDLNSVDWSHLIFHPKYANIVDIFEGGWFHTKNVWRSEPNSCMNNNVPYFSAISRQEIVERIKRIAGEPFDIDDFFAKDVLFMNGPSTKAVRHEPNVPYMSGEQFPPKYMGERPEFDRTK